jgi:hypothetical protein
MRSARICPLLSFFPSPPLQNFSHHKSRHSSTLVLSTLIPFGIGLVLLSFLLGLPRTSPFDSLSSPPPSPLSHTRTHTHTHTLTQPHTSTFHGLARPCRCSNRGTTTSRTEHSTHPVRWTGGQSDRNAVRDCGAVNHPKRPCVHPNVAMLRPPYRRTHSPSLVAV